MNIFIKLKSENFDLLSNSKFVDFCRSWKRQLLQRSATIESHITNFFHWNRNSQVFQWSAAVKSEFLDFSHRRWNRNIIQWWTTTKSRPLNASDSWWDFDFLKRLAVTESVMPYFGDRFRNGNHLQWGASEESRLFNQCDRRWDYELGQWFASIKSMSWNDGYWRRLLKRNFSECCASEECKITQFSDWWWYNHFFNGLTIFEARLINLFNTRRNDKLFYFRILKWNQFIFNTRLQERIINDIVVVTFSTNDGYLRFIIKKNLNKTLFFLLITLFISEWL